MTEGRVAWQGGVLGEGALPENTGTLPSVRTGTTAGPAADATASGASAVTRASLQADLAHAQARNTRLAGRVQQLEKRLSSELGQQAWRESGLGAALDVDELQRTVTRLEQRSVELTETLQETQADLKAAREANRDLTRVLNQRGQVHASP